MPPLTLTVTELAVAGRMESAADLAKLPALLFGRLETRSRVDA